MEKIERLSEEETYMWIPCKFLDQTLEAIFKCLGLLHHDSPTTKTESSPVDLNQPLQEEEEEKEDAAMGENDTVTSMGSKNGVVVTSRATKVKAKKKKKERVSSGSSGKHHDYDV